MDYVIALELNCPFLYTDAWDTSSPRESKTPSTGIYLSFIYCESLQGLTPPGQPKKEASCYRHTWGSQKASKQENARASKPGEEETATTFPESR